MRYYARLIKEETGNDWKGDERNCNHLYEVDSKMYELIETILNGSLRRVS